MADCFLGYFLGRTYLKEVYKERNRWYNSLPQAQRFPVENSFSLS
jgi:hypothetical protein